MRIGDQGGDGIIADRGHLQEPGTCQVWRQRAQGVQGNGTIWTTQGCVW